MARKNPVARVGNYTSPMDTTGIDQSMKKLMLGQAPANMNKVESDYAKSKDDPTSAYEAIRRTRRANRR